MTGSQRSSVMGDRRQSEVGSVVSHATANTTASRYAPHVPSSADTALPAHAMLLVWDQWSTREPRGCQVVFMCTCRSSQPVEVRLPTEYLKVIDQLGAAREKTLQVCFMTLVLA